MDTEQARTFLTVVAAGNFVMAAERLHVSQSTVSTRIHTLEQQLGCTLFVRNKSGTTLTHAGRQFQRHASNIVRAVEQARHDIGVPEGFSGALVVGGRIGLWEEFLLQWLALMHEQNPDISIRAESELEPEIMPGLIEGRIDIGVMYTPQSRPGLTVERLFDERLVLISSEPDAHPEPESGYVYVDWGPEFYTRHKTFFPDFSGAAFTVNVGWLGLQHLLHSGGSGYFPLRLVQPHLQSKRLTLVDKAPEFLLPAYVVYPTEHDPTVFRNAIELMHTMAKSLQPANRRRSNSSVEKKRAKPARRR
jgi:DNA-binding transcriptional LysR family regulator